MLQLILLPHVFQFINYTFSLASNFWSLKFHRKLYYQHVAFVLFVRYLLLPFSASFTRNTRGGILLVTCSFLSHLNV